MWSYGITVGDLCLLTGKEAISKIEMCDLVLMCSGLYMEFSLLVFIAHLYELFKKKQLTLQFCEQLILLLLKNFMQKLVFTDFCHFVYPCGINSLFINHKLFFQF